MSTGPVDPNKPVSTEEQHVENSDGYDDSWMEHHYDHGDKISSKNAQSSTSVSKSAYQARSTTAGQIPNTAHGLGVGAQKLGGLAKGADFAALGENQVSQYIQQLKSQGQSNTQIKQLVEQQFGVVVSDTDISWAEQGFQSGGQYGPNKYYGSYGNSPVFKSYGSDNYLQQYLWQNQVMQQTQQTVHDAKKSQQQEVAKIHKILLMIMMGDISGALREYNVIMDRDLRMFSRQIVDKLGQVRRARARVIMNFASEQAPRAYAGSDPNAAARAQDQSQRYTQYVQLATQAMGELQTTERNLVDALGTMKRDLDNMWQSYASMRDADTRVSERLMTTR